MPNKLQQTTAAGVPSWINKAVGPIRTQPGNNPQALAYVDANNPQPTINVQRPDLYTPSIAAHESTHLYQNTRNRFFQKGMQQIAPTPGDRAAYDYGGVKGIQANPLKSIGNYNHEQQAQMVQDLTSAQDSLHPGMSPTQLQAWDTTKNTLERPIQQLQRVPGPDTSLANRADSWLNNHGIAGNPAETLKAVFSPPSMNTRPMPMQGPPSTALGYANPSRLVR